MHIYQFRLTNYNTVYDFIKLFGFTVHDMLKFKKVCELREAEDFRFQVYCSLN